jgi:hypothetical protein
MNWRPLSARDTADPRFDAPAEGLPAWLLRPVTEWVRDSFLTQIQGHRPRVNGRALESLQLDLRLEPPLGGKEVRDRLANLLERIGRDQEFGLDALDWMLHNAGFFAFQKRATRSWAERLGQVLEEGGSAWEVSHGEAGFALTRRSVGPVAEVLEQAAPAASRAHAHLSLAWSRLMGRSPDPSAAYRESVRAVEAIAKPVILPDNDRATLGQMIAALREKPQKWTVVLGSVEELRTEMEAVWRGQLDRHGTDDPTAPLHVSHAEADVAFAICLSLVRRFAGGHVERVD